MRSNHRPVILLLLSPLLFSLTTALGFNWGTSSSHPLPPSKVVTGLLRANNITKVKLADANADVLESLSGTGISVIVGVPNEMLETLNSSKKAAESWVHDNVTRYFSGGGVGSGVRIEYIAIGDEPFLLSYGQQFQPFVIGAAMNIQLALITAKLTNKIKVIVPCSFDVFEYNSTNVLNSNSTVNSSSTIPLPSKAHFRNDLNKTITELLFFLKKQGSPFVVDFNPFSSFQQSKNLSIDYFLFHPKARAITDGHNKYNNFFDASIDTMVTSLSKTGFGEMEIIIGRIGWPTDGAINATTAIAEKFMKGLVDHLHSKDIKKHPLETYIFSLLDEDQRSITTGNIERHWGLFTFDGQAKYNVDLGQGSKELVNAHNVDYLPSKWGFLCWRWLAWEYFICF
ncbi:uncharacterized protein A4U43_C05F4830 [Asparagus officinalis]|uniref:Glucan endo-1,3-beta-D-glucosidase n=1 Tax=Asparagus officinalis TaxID=4686 RepID=A0A5P1ERX1_ASPOF|nr:uncharacterized protein A4U43_C05F4830 [Asparagus officinalis]